MATTTESAPPPPAPVYPEHDKLGPLGDRTSVLEHPGELRRILVGELAAAADATREAARAVDHDADGAVHAYRKALRRARALVAMIAGGLPKSERRAVARALRDARRALGPARDHAVGPGTLSALPLPHTERMLADGAARAAAATKPVVAELAQLLGEGAARTAAQVEAIQAALPPELSWEVVLDGVRATYDAARRARKAGKRSRRQFHAWRRRSKELVYQLAVLADHAGPHVGELHREIDAACGPLGPAVDLIMARDFVRTYGEGDVDLLIDAIEVHAAELMRASRKTGKPAFQRKPRGFARRLTKAVHRDLAPAETDIELA